MNNINEGNLYNVEDEISHKRDASSSGIKKWQLEIRKQIVNLLRRQNLPNAEKIISQTFGPTLDQQ